MAASEAKLRDKFEDLKVTPDEIERIGKALKDEEFRKLFAEYADEISDPENRKRYEAEIQQLERENGMDLKFINPEPGYVLKTSVDGNTKAFINVCKNENVGKPSSRKEKGPNGHYGMAWSIPHSFAPVREDTDKNGQICKVFDFVVHPDTYRMAESNARFKKMINETAMDGIDKQFNMKIDRKNVKIPKMKFKGTASPTVIRTKIDGAKPVERSPDDVLSKLPYPYDNIPTEEKARMREEKMKEERAKSAKQKGDPKTQSDDNDGFTKPVFSIKHRCEFDMQDFRDAADSRPSTRPKELVIEINLPLLDSAAPVSLDIFEKSLKLESSKPAKYRLHLDLPYPVDESEGSAKFNKSKHSLTVTLPVVPAIIPRLPFTGEAPSKPGDSQSEPNDDGPPAEGKPLIEVLSSQDATDTSPGSTVESSPDSGNEPHDSDDSTCKDSHEKSWPLSDDNIPRDLPQYDYHQDDEAVSFVLHVKNISRERIEMSFSPDQTCCHLRFSSVGSGCFPVEYSFYISFPEQFQVESEQCRVEVSHTNAVLVLVKQDECIGLWDSFCAGLGATQTEEKRFATKNNVKRLLDSLDSNTDAKKDSDTQLEVTHMADDKLTILVKDADSGDHLQSRHSPETTELSSCGDKQRPKLHGILRQRSYTVCETGSDSLTNDLSRQNSVLSSEGSGQPESDENSETSSGSRRRRSVSFSEYVERTTFKTSQTVSSMRSTLKSKRKRARRREQKQVARQIRRRRSSSGSEVSSDERASSSGGQHKAASTRKGSDDGASSEVTTESESRDTDEHPSDDDDVSGEEDCFEADAASGGAKEQADDVKLEGGMKDLTLTEDTAKDTRSVTQKRVQLEVTAGPMTEISCGPPAADSSGSPAADSSGSPAADSSGPPAADSSGPPAADSSGPPAADSSVSPAADSSGAPAADSSGSPAADSSGSPAADSSVSPAADSSGAPAADSSGSPAADSSGAPAADSSGSPAADSSGAPAADSCTVLPGDSPGKNYLNGDTGDMLSSIVKDDDTESVGKEGEETPSPGTGESPVGEGKKAELIQEVRGRDGKAVNGDVNGSGEGEEGSSGRRDKDAPETILSWDDTPVANDPVNSTVSFSNSLMYDLDDDD